MFVLYSYYLERSNSAKMTFKRAIEIFPIEVSCDHLCTHGLVSFLDIVILGIFGYVNIQELNLLLTYSNSHGKASTCSCM